jgi:Flp pilus assembly protein TadG
VSTSEARGEAGQVTAFVVVFVVALVFLAGLVIDGGYVLAARRRAMNEAQAAARAGAQALNLDAYRGGGTYTLDPDGARSAALSYLDRTGHGDGAAVDVTGDTVSVSVSFDQPLNILGIAGAPAVSVSGAGSARSARGVVSEAP